MHIDIFFFLIQSAPSKTLVTRYIRVRGMRTDNLQHQHPYSCNPYHFYGCKLRTHHAVYISCSLKRLKGKRREIQFYNFGNKVKGMKRERETRSFYSLKGFKICSVVV